MTDINISELLQKVIIRSKNVDNLFNEKLTAERFFVTLIDMISLEENYITIEWCSAKSTVESMFGDLKKARTGFLEFIKTENVSAEADEKYIQHIWSSLSADIDELFPAIIGIDSLTTAFKNEPNGAINKVMADSKKTEDKPKQTVYFDDFEFLFDEDEIEEFFSESKQEKVEEDVKSTVDFFVSDAKRIRSELKSAIFGQDNAINTFVTGYFQAQLLKLTDKTKVRPKATFLFAGPPGVGKTFLAEKAAESLKLPYKRFDMSEYSDNEAIIEFCGSDKVYKNGKAGNVTSFVEKNPRCILLFDEIEKAHISVIYLFLQMLDAGRLRDNFTDTEVSFSDAIIILTTNAGKGAYEGKENEDLSSINKKVIIKALEKDVNPKTNTPYFPAAICSRFASGNVVMFNHINAHNLYAIAKREFERHSNNIGNDMKIDFKIDERIYGALLFSEGGSADARTVRSKAESFFNNEFYELLRFIGSDKVKSGISDIEEIRFSVNLKDGKSEIVNLFAPAKKDEILVFASPETVGSCEKQHCNACFSGAQDTPEAMEIIKNKDVRFILIDMAFGAENTDRRLNLEDVESPARCFFRHLKEQGLRLPVYLLLKDELNEEEKISFLRQGVRGTVHLDDKFLEQVLFISSALYQQENMTALARANKVVSFETAQSVSDDGKVAEIQLFDFRMTVAVDPDDSKNILNAVSRPDVRFEEVMGAKDAKEELKYFVEYLKNPKKYMGTGVKTPKGIILYGPPGTGKTLLAKALASEADVPFIAAEGNQFLKKALGEGSEHVHELFRSARKYAPSILFIDEIDAIAKERTGGSAASGEDTLTAFLTEMDGFRNDPTRPVFVLAATNFDVEAGNAKSLDGALMRRFDRRIFIDLPQKEDRINFLKMKVRDNRALNISDDQIENVAVRATGMSLAQLDSVIELSLRSAIRKGMVTVDDELFGEAFETFNGGEVKKWDSSQLERVARHEAGHALMCYLNGDMPTYLTIVARGNHGGYMLNGDNEDKNIYTLDELLGLIRVSLGGRASEIVYYGERDGITTGASGDIKNATLMAQSIVCDYGMDEKFGIGAVSATVASGGDMALEIRKTVNEILNTQMAETIDLIRKNKNKADKLVNALLSKNHLNEKEIKEILFS